MPMSLSSVTGMPLTIEQLHGLLAQVDQSILNLLVDGPDAASRYRVGDREVDRDGYLRWLLETRREYVLAMSRMPVWEATQVVEESRCLR